MLRVFELSLGDWAIDAQDPQHRPIKVGINSLKNINEHPLDPLPISEEFLLHNGFEEVKDGLFLTFWRQKEDEKGNEIYDITIYYHPTYDGKFDTRIRCKGTCNKFIANVHELQHALRLCEIDEVANDFQAVEWDEDYYDAEGNLHIDARKPKVANSRVLNLNFQVTAPWRMAEQTKLIIHHCDLVENPNVKDLTDVRKTKDER